LRPQELLHRPQEQAQSRTLEIGVALHELNAPTRTCELTPGPSQTVPNSSDDALRPVTILTRGLSIDNAPGSAGAGALRSLT